MSNTRTAPLLAPVLSVTPICIGSNPTSVGSYAKVIVVRLEPGALMILLLGSYARREGDATEDAHCRRHDKSIQ